MANKFTAQVDDFIKDSEARALAVFQAAAQDVIQDAQIIDEQGGRMPLDTSFLVNSGQASIDVLPTGPDVKPKNYTHQDWKPGETVTTINKVKLGDTLYFGWTANYARFMENKFIFMRSAAQRWPEHVAKRAAEFKN